MYYYRIIYRVVSVRDLAIIMHFFWCQWLCMDETNLLGWSLNMTSTCLEHKTRIALAESRIERESLFHDVAMQYFAIVGL